MRIYIFAYGSLMCPESCARTLSKKVAYIPAKLNGFERIYNALGTVYSVNLDKKVPVRFANINKNRKKECYGLLFEVCQEDLNKLSQRETGYDLVDVTSDISITYQKKLNLFNENIHDVIEGTYEMKVFTFIDSKNNDKFKTLSNSATQLNKQNVLSELEESFILKNYTNLMLNASKQFPHLEKQIKKELEKAKDQKWLEGGFLSITGLYK
jgi:cation transport regulator ChaC